MLRWREAVSTHSGEDAEKGVVFPTQILSSCPAALRAVETSTEAFVFWSRFGSIKEILSYSLCETSRMTRRMSSSNTLPTRPVIVGLSPEVTLCSLVIDLVISSVKAYGELPENAKINETDNFGEEDGECTFEFGDEGEVDIDDI